MVSVVSGYVCFSSCDEAKARQGKDPKVPQNTLPRAPHIKKKSAFAGQPAAIPDGAVKKSANTTSLAGAADGGTDTTGQSFMDILV